MSEPIELYDVEGNLVTLYSPRYAQGLVDKGELFVAPPTIAEPEEAEESEDENPQKKTVTKRPSKKEA